MASRAVDPSQLPPLSESSRLYPQGWHETLDEDSEPTTVKGKITKVVIQPRAGYGDTWDPDNRHRKSEPLVLGADFSVKREDPRGATFVLADSEHTYRIPFADIESAEVYYHDDGALARRGTVLSLVSLGPFGLSVLCFVGAQAFRSAGGTDGSGTALVGAGVGFAGAGLGLAIAGISNLSDAKTNPRTNPVSVELGPGGGRLTFSF